MSSPVPWLAPSADMPHFHIAGIALLQAVGILVVAWLLNRLLRLVLERLCRRYDFAPAFAIGSRPSRASPSGR